MTVQDDLDDLRGRVRAFLRALDAEQADPNAGIARSIVTHAAIGDLRISVNMPPPAPVDTRPLYDGDGVHRDDIYPEVTRTLLRMQARPDTGPTDRRRGGPLITDPRIVEINPDVEP